MKRQNEQFWWFVAFVVNTVVALGVLAFVALPPNLQVWLGAYLLLSNGMFTYFRDKPKKGGK